MKIALKGEHPAIPAHCSEGLRILIKSCLNLDVTARPSFIQIQGFLAVLKKSSLSIPVKAMETSVAVNENAFFQPVVAPVAVPEVQIELGKDNEQIQPFGKDLDNQDSKDVDNQYLLESSSFSGL